MFPKLNPRNRKMMIGRIRLRTMIKMMMIKLNKIRWDLHLVIKMTMMILIKLTQFKYRRLRRSR